MKRKYLLIGLSFTLLLFSCGYSGKNNKRPEPASDNREKIKETREWEEDDIDIEEEANERNEHNDPSHRAPHTSKMRRQGKGVPVPVPEKESIRSKVPNKEIIDKRVDIARRMMEAELRGDMTLYNRLEEEAKELTGKMSIAEQNEAYRQIKDLRKRYF